MGIDKTLRQIPNAAQLTIYKESFPYMLCNCKGIGCNKLRTLSSVLFTITSSVFYFKGLKSSRTYDSFH